MELHGGLITLRDLAGGCEPLAREPWSVRYRDHLVLSAPPPAGGLQVLLGLNVLQHFEPAEMADAQRAAERIAATARMVFSQRERWPVHADDLTPSLALWLLGPQRAAGLAEDIRTGRFAPSADPEGPGETTHICTADALGNIVSLTQSVQSLFGAKVANEALGFLYNNYLSICPR